MKVAFIILILFSIQLVGQQNKITQHEFREDFEFFWKAIDEDYCYFDKKKTDWIKVKKIYSPIIDTVKTQDQFISILEKVFYETYDHHASLNTNTIFSQRLVPSGTDLWAEFINGIAVITEVRKHYGAQKVGITAGMEVTGINDIPVLKAIEPFIGKSFKSIDDEARSYALRLALAGNHIKPRKISVNTKPKMENFYPDADGLKFENIRYESRIESNIVDQIGYIKINDFLFDNDLIREFDSVMHQMQNTKSLILDLRETPSGGNTTVARAILGWFINKEEFYQKHVLPADEKVYGVKRSWIEIVSPRAGKYYGQPVVVLANHWTGSVGEGIVIAFDAFKRASIIGTTLARLNGAIYTYQMSNTKINFSFPVEKLFHVNGMPRELYVPDILIDYTKINFSIDNDPTLEKAFEVLKKLGQ